MSRRIIFALVLSLSVVVSAAQAAPAVQPDQVCVSGQRLSLVGNGPPNAAVLARWSGRHVGGGVIDGSGNWRVELKIGNEANGRHTIVVEVRGTGEIVLRTACVIGGPATPTPAPRPSGTPAPTATAAPTTPATPTPVPTAPGAANVGKPLNTGGRDLFNCPDFETWAQAKAVLDANQPGDPNGLDEDNDGVPCEALPGAPTG